MADNTTKSFSSLTTKQKVVGVFTLIIIVFIIYEVIGLFSSGGKPEATTITPAAVAPKPGATTTGAAVITAAASTAPPAMQQNTQQIPTLTQVNVLTPPKESVEVPQQQQQTYMDSLNQLQLLKVKREIAETNQAIASARLATETANKNMSDLLTQPSIPVVSQGAYANALTGAPAPLSPLNANTQKPAPVVVKPVQPEFVVISVSMEFDHWTAVLGSEGKLYSVSIGDTLVDGSTIVSISRSGVVLSKDGKRKKIGIQTSI